MTDTDARSAHTAETRGEREKLEQARDALREAEKWLLLPSDTYPQHWEALGRAREAIRAALACPDGDECADAGCRDHGDDPHTLVPEGEDPA